MRKRVFSWLLVLIMAISMVQVYAFAQEVTVYTDSSYQVNDVYDTGTSAHYEEPTEGSSYTALVAPVTYASYGTINEAAEDLREAMVARQGTVVVKYKMTTSTNDTERRAQLKQSVHDLSDIALAHTGIPNEGDYLRRHYGGWNVNYSWTTSGSTANVEATYTLTYYTTAAQEAEVTAKIDSLLEAWNLSRASEYEKIRTIYDYITASVRYDYDTLNIDSYKLKYTAYAALMNNTAVCQGYANLFYRMALELGVDCRLISGIGNGGRHGWNIVEIGGKYYNLDSTWDEGRSNYSWFLLSPANFTDHYRDDEFDTSSFHAEYPMSTNNYTPADTMLTVTKQPASVSVLEGETAKITVTAKGEGLTYKWYFKNPGATKYSYTSSFKGNSYSVTMDDSRNGRLVYCVITDKTGNSVKTKTVRLTMKNVSELTVTQQPKTSYTKLNGTASATVSATGDGLKYQWYVKNAGSTSWIKSSITSKTYSVKMTSAVKNRQVYCVITDKYGDSIKTNTAVLRMAATITTQPTNGTAATGQTVKISVKAAGDGLKYQWYIKNAGSTTWAKSSITSSTYSVKISSSTKGRQVYCVVTDKYGKTAKTNTVTIGTPVTITTQPKTTYTKQGDTAKSTVKATGDGLKYQWYVKNVGDSAYKKSSVTASTYNVKMSSSSKDRLLYCVVTNKYGISVKTNTVRLRMAATVTTQPKTSYTQQGDTATVTVKATGDGLTYQWYVKNAGASAFVKSSNTTATYSVKMSSTTRNRQLYCIVKDKYGKTVKTNTVHLRMAATITSQPTSTSAKVGETVKVTVKAVGDGLTYTWYIKNAGSATWSKSSITTNTYSVKMSSATKNRKIYCVVTDKYGNTVKSKTFTLTTNNISATFDLDVIWGYQDDLYCHYAECTVTPGGGSGDYQYKFNVYIDADDPSPATSNTFSDSDYYCYWYTDGSSIAGTVLEVTVMDSAGDQVVYRIDTVNKTVLSKKFL